MKTKFQELFSNVQEGQASFNSGISRIQLMQEFYRDFHQARVGAAWKMALECLRSLYLLVHSKCSEEQRKKYREMDETAETHLYGKWYRDHFGNRKHHPVGNYRKSIYELALYVEDLCESTGLGMPSKQGVGDSIADME